MNKEQFSQLFSQWNAAIQSGDPDQVVALYAEDAILLPTLSNQVRHNHKEIRDYFVSFTAKGPKGTIEEANIRSFAEILLVSGTYQFDFKAGDSARARFTYAYKKINGKWLIAEHHSSQMPEG